MALHQFARLLVAFVFVFSSVSAHGAAMHSQQALDQAVTNALNHPNVGSIGTLIFDTPNGSPVQGTFVEVRDTDPFYDYAISSAHMGVTGGVVHTNPRGGFDLNLISGPFGEGIEVVDWGYHPDYTDGSIGMNDLLWLKYRPTQTEGVYVSFDAIEQNERMTTIGYGTPYVAGSGYLPRDGGLRAYHTYADRFATTTNHVFPMVFDETTVHSEFRPLSERDNLLAAGGTAGDSGGPWLNELDYVVAITSGGWSTSAPMVDYGGFSVGTRLSEYESFITANIPLSNVPEPASAIAILVLGGFLAVRRPER